MSKIKLKIAGFGYSGDSAGTGGDQYEADAHGFEQDAIWYRIPGNLAKISELTGWNVFGDYVGKAYLGSSERSALANLGVEIEERSVRGAGAGNYVLWRVE